MGYILVSKPHHWWPHYSYDNILCSGIRLYIFYLSSRLPNKMLHCYYI